MDFLGRSFSFPPKYSESLNLMEKQIVPFTDIASTDGVVGMVKSRGETSASAGSPTLFSNQLIESSRSVMQQHQDMVNRHALCLTRLRQASLDAEALRLENTKLRSINRDLNTQLDQLIRSSVESHFDYNSTPLHMINGLSNLFIGGNSVGQREDQNRVAGWDEISDESPTSVMENEDLERSSLPKSISVRSNEYTKATVVGGAGPPGKSRGAMTKPRTSSRITKTQKVYVRGGKKEEEEDEIEVEVYNQGMTKTELCNKWQETGACPYGDHCQFAHGIEELRPVIRHPRYKTDVCRMVLAGDVCPYGHRCHFRHALTEQEKPTEGGFKAKPLKLM